MHWRCQAFPRRKVQAIGAGASFYRPVPRVAAGRRESASEAASPPSQQYGTQRNVLRPWSSCSRTGTSDMQSSASFSASFTARCRSTTEPMIEPEFDQTAIIDARAKEILDENMLPDISKLTDEETKAELWAGGGCCCHEAGNLGSAAD